MGKKKEKEKEKKCCLRWYREREERERESGRQTGRYVEGVKWECVESVSLSVETVDKKKG